MSSTPHRPSSNPAGFTRIGPSRPATSTGTGAGSSGAQRPGGSSSGPARTGAGATGPSRTGTGATGPARTGTGATGPARTGTGGSAGGPPRPGGGGGYRPGGGGPGRPGPHGGQRSGGGRGGRGKPQQRRPEPPKEEDVKEKEEAIELEGVITAVLAGTMFRVKLKNGHEVLAHISGKMRKKFIRLVIGDGVKLEMSPYDMDKARIVYRL